MRQLKFRGWHNGKMFYPIKEESFANITFHSFQGIAVSKEEKEGIHIMQSTCFFDKNGDEVYEGDIIKSPLGNIVLVLYGQKVLQFGVDRIECNGWIVKNKNGLTETLDESFLQGEVIGNIYQNPDLL